MPSHDRAAYRQVGRRAASQQHDARLGQPRAAFRTRPPLFLKHLRSRDHYTTESIAPGAERDLFGILVSNVIVLAVVGMFRMIEPNPNSGLNAVRSTIM